MQLRGSITRLVRWLCCAVLVVTPLLVVLFGPQIQGPDVDDGWFFWKAWNLRMLGGRDDPLFHGFGVTLFGRIWIELLASAYQAASWNLIGGRVLSTAAILGTALVWHRLAARLGFDPAQRLVLAALIVVLLPFVKAAMVARPEAFVLFLASLSVLLLDKRYFSLAGIASALALESHQMGLAALSYVAAWTWRMRWAGQSPGSLLLDRGNAFRFVAGFAAGAFLYAALHWQTLLHPSFETLGPALGRQINFSPAFVEYFVTHSLAHRLWVGLLIVSAAGLYTARRGWRQEPLPLFILLCVAIPFLLEPHGNPFYLVYAFVPVALVFARLSQGVRVLALVAAIVVVSESAYGWRIYVNQAYTEKALTQALERALGPPAEPALIEPRYFPLLRTRPNLASISDIPAYMGKGLPFSVAAPDSMRALVERQLPEGTSAAEIDLGPNARAYVFRVGP